MAMVRPYGGLKMESDIKYQIDVFQIFQEEHKNLESFTQCKDRVEKRYDQFVKIFANELRTEIIKQRKNKVRNICRSCLEFLWQLNIAGFEFINNELKIINE